MKHYSKILCKFGILLYLISTSVFAANSISSAANKFAQYPDLIKQIAPQVKPYKVATDFSNITNFNDYKFSAEQKKLLVANAFIVVPKENLEFFEIYEGNRYGNLPNFVTTDSLLHNYHLLFKHLLNSVEQEKLLPELKELSAAMLVESNKQYINLHGTKWENAAKRNIAYFAVAAKLLNPKVKVPLVVQQEVAQEMQLISTHSQITLSPVMNTGAKPNDALEGLKEDYSQYLPRGHYTFSANSKAYFKAMQWYGRLTFRFKNADEVRSTILLTLALNNGFAKKWENVYEPISFFVGKSDDVNFYQLNSLTQKIYGPNPALKVVTKDEKKFSELQQALMTFAPPQINSMPIFNAVLQPDRAKEVTGFRFLGQRFTLDAATFQQLVVRAVGPKNQSCTDKPYSEGRMLPKGLDIPAAFGSTIASKILEDEGEFAYACYPENLNKIKNYIAQIDKPIWTQNLYWGWLYALMPLTKEKSSGFPPFMSNNAWAKKELNTFLGSWTELKHDTMLYAKQVYAEMGDGSEPKDDRGYVEPNPDVYTRLTALIDMTIAGLESRQLLSPKNKELLSIMHTLTLSLQKIAEKELQNIKLSANEFELIRSYGGQLEHFWLDALSDEGIHSVSQLPEHPAAIVADVATDPNGQVLEEGTGNVDEIFVVVPIDGKLRIASGGVYSYYEFPHAITDRLTDEKWRSMLLNKAAPQSPTWTSAFRMKDQ